MPRIVSVFETCLYVDDLERARSFYRDLFGFPVLVADDRVCSLAVARDSVLILFLRGSTLQPVALPGGAIPPHDGQGPAHFALSMERQELEAWRAELAARNISIEGEVTWPLGGISIYFRDPDGHLVELATPGVWDFDKAFSQKT